MFLLLQKRPRAYNQLTNIPIVQNVQNRQLVGGNLEATTYRPPSIFTNIAQQQPQFLHRRNDQSFNQQSTQFTLSPVQYIQQQQQHQQLLPQQQQFVHQQIIPQQQIQQPIAHLQQLYLLRQQPLLHQQQQQQQLFEKRLDQNTYTPHQPVPYTPFTHSTPQQQQQQQFQHNIHDQLVYNQLLQQRRLYEEQQLRQQFNRPHNRFQLQ